MTPDQADAALVRHLAPPIVQLPSGLIALCWWDRPTEFYTTLAEVPIPSSESLLEAHRARQAVHRPLAERKLGATDLSDLLGL